MATPNQDHIIKAKVFDYAFDSTNQLQYCPGWEVEFNVTKGTVKIPATGYTIGFVRQLFWLKTQGKRNWIMQFDRASSTSVKDRLWFCKECGQPFDRLSEFGNHTKTEHNKTKAIVDQTHAQEADDEEQRLLAEADALEAGAETDEDAVITRKIAKESQVGV